MLQQARQAASARRNELHEEDSLRLLDDYSQDSVEAGTAPDTLSVTYLDKLLDRQGWRRTHTHLFAVAFLALFASAIQTVAVSFVLPYFRDELSFSSAQCGWILTMIYVGMLCGDIVFGPLGDRIGRRNSLVISLSLGAFAMIAAGAWIKLFWHAMMIFFCAGFAAGPTLMLAFVYFGEFWGTLRRSKALMLLGFSWLIGTSCLALHAFLLLGTSEKGMWRTFLMTGAVPSLLAAALLLMSPQSPFFLLQARRESLLRRTLFRLTHEPAVHERRLDSRARVASESKFLEMLKIRSTLRPLATVGLLYFSLSFAYYGLVQWLPEFLDRINEPAAGTADQDTDELNIYFVVLLSNLSQIPGNSVALWLVHQHSDRGLRVVTIASLALSAGATVLFALANDSTQATVASCVLGAVSIGAWSALNVLCAAAFPSRVRTTAFGSVAALGRIGSILGVLAFGYLVDVGRAVPILLAAAFFAVAALAAILHNYTPAKDTILTVDGGDSDCD
ncbi:MAG: hypothetical protein MHM6MM_003289 [Cercozoa sp. M6MM]